MKLPNKPVLINFNSTMSYGYSERLGTVNVDIDIPLDRTKCLNGLSTIDCITNDVLENLIDTIDSYTANI